MHLRSHRSHFAALLAAFLLFAPSARHALAQNTPDTAAQDNNTPADVFDPATSTPAEDSKQAWAILSKAAADKHSLVRVQSLAAIGLVDDERSAGMIADALDDPDVDVRTAAVLACGQSHRLLLIGKLHNMLDDKEPQVAFAAATTLWKLKDHTGQDILMAVANGDRPANAGFRDDALHTMSRDLHNPSTLARVGALQGASLLLGPFGFGLGAIEAMRKNGGNASRVVAIEQLSEERTGPVRAQLVSALGDKDLAVRAAAAKALRDYREPEISKALANLFIDTKPPVRYTAAAAYLHSASAAPAAAKASAPVRTPARAAAKKR